MVKKTAKVWIALAIAAYIIVGLFGTFGCSTDKVKTQVDVSSEITTTEDTGDTEGMLKMPSVVGNNLYTTILLLKERGFTNVWHYSSDDGIYEGFENWRIISQNIDAWTYIDPNEQIILVCEWDPKPTTAAVPETTVTRYVETTAATTQATQATHTYILNTNTGKIHIVGCSSVKKMKDSNKLEVVGTLEDILNWYPGYSVCGNCHAQY